MGLRYTLRLYKGTDSTTFREILAQAAKSLGGSIRWGIEGSGDRDLRLAHNGQVHSISLPYQNGNDFIFCQKVGCLLGLPWLELRIQEGSLWDYCLYRGGDLLDTFSVCPQYWEYPETEAETMAEWQGKPEVLADTWGLPVKRIEKYLVNWGYRSKEGENTFEFKRKGKAYPTDKYPYGDYEQFFDVLKVLGGQEPIERHRIRLPNQLPAIEL